MRRAIFAILSTIVALVMLLSFKTHGAVTAGSIAPPAAVSGGTSSSDGATTSPPSSGSTSAPSSGTSSAATKITGDAVDTRFGPVQVQITVASGKLTAVQAIVYPQENSRDQEINSYAIPQLNQEAAQAGSANIDMVSGATYTSDGYISSLQSALDRING
jgi:uncharacterized protein with FMN-binding domain